MIVIVIFLFSTFSSAVAMDVNNLLSIDPYCKYFFLNYITPQRNISYLLKNEIKSNVYFQPFHLRRDILFSTI